MGIKTFYVNRTGKAWVYLRRFCYATDAATKHYHDAKRLIDICDEWKQTDNDDDGWHYANSAIREMDRSDTRWPKQCECGYEFTPQDEWQIFTSAIYRRADNGEQFPLNHLPEGAMYDAEWLPEQYGVGEDGRRLYVVCPGGSTWGIDCRASNCTMPDDNNHKCWVRHGTVPNITVDKDGATCSAGGGSIIAGNYHGFLRNGEFT